MVCLEGFRAARQIDARQTAPVRERHRRKGETRRQTLIGCRVFVPTVLHLIISKIESMAEGCEGLLGRLCAMVRQVGLMACAALDTNERWKAEMESNAANTHALDSCISR